MSERWISREEVYEIYPIGYIRRSEEGIFIKVLEPFQAGLRQMEHFSHVLVLWWADRHDNEQSRGILQTEPPYAQGKITGVFATRAEYRPNPIAVTTCKILVVDEDEGAIQIAEIDAYDGTRVVDLKAYFPVCDRVKEAHIPGWLSDWPEWMPEEGLGL